MPIGSTERDVQRVVNKLKRLPLAYQKKVLKKIYKRNAKPLIATAKGNIPKAAKTVHRYSNGKIVASYSPGNLRRSIGVLPLRRSRSVFVGPRTGGNRKNDGWYGHFLELGTVKQRGIHYMERAYKATRNIVINGITMDVKRVLKSYLRKNRIR